MSSQCGHAVPFPEDFSLHEGQRRVQKYETRKEVHVKERWRGRALNEVLQEEFGLSAAYVEVACQEGRLQVNQRACQADDTLENGDCIHHQFLAEEPPIPDEAVEVLAEGEHVLVARKPAGLPCHPQGKFRKASLTEVLKTAHLKDTQAYLHPVNRLDLPTSGVVLLAKTRKGYMQLSRLLGTMRKVYLARVQGTFACDTILQEHVESRPAGPGMDWLGLAASPQEVLCQLPLLVDKHKPGQPLTVLVDTKEGKPAATTFRLVSSTPGDGTPATSLLLCQPQTGRTHQIRVHLAALGHPIVGDPVYGQAGPTLRAAADEEEAAAGMCLHAMAYAISLEPEEGERDRESLRAVLPGEVPIAPSIGPVVYRARLPTWAGGISLLSS